MASSIAAFVSVRLSGPTGPTFCDILERKSTQEGGCAVEAIQDADFAVTFPRITSALSFVRQVHEVLSRDNLQTLHATKASIGIECGEQPGTPAKRIQPLERSAELAGLAHPGQNLVGPAGRELARPILPSGYMLIELGEIRLGNSISADKVSQLSIVGFPDDFPRIDALDEVVSNVADLTTDFIGREPEALKVQKLLLDSNLVSIIGPAGVGKSSLAHWLAFDLAEAYRDGTWRVDLSKIPKGGNVATAIAADLRLPAMPKLSAEDRVKIAFSTLDGLVWLDNCEHVINETRDLLARLTKFCPKVRFLITSRIRLRLEDEVVLELEPFKVPSDPDEVLDCEAVRLFVNRSRSANPGVVFSPSDLLKAGEICGRVDGLPLAIELAAAQVAKHPLGDILEKLSDAMHDPLSGPSRHKTLDRAMSWSYSLLSEREQRFFRHLAALSGPTNRELTIAAGTAGRKDANGEVTLDSLVAASLVQESSPKGPLSYRLLEPVRQFALDQLTRNDELRGAKTKFAAALLHWIEKLRDARLPMSRWVATIDRERSNIDESLEWVLQGAKDGRMALTLCAELYDYWIRQGPYAGAYQCYEKAIRLGKTTPAADIADIYIWMGTFAGYAGHYEEAKAAFKKALELHEKADKKHRMAVTLDNLALHLRNNDEQEEAFKANQRSVELSEESDPNYPMRITNKAFHLAEVGRIEESRQWLERAAEINKVIDDPWVRACQQGQRIVLALSENNTTEAERHAADCLASYRECGNLQGLICSIEVAGFIALRIGYVEKAAKLIAGADKCFLATGVGRPKKDEKQKRLALDAIEQALGSDVAEAVYLQGALLSLDQLYDLARSGSSLSTL